MITAQEIIEAVEKNPMNIDFVKWYNSRLNEN